MLNRKREKSGYKLTARLEFFLIIGLVICTKDIHDKLQKYPYTVYRLDSFAPPYPRVRCHRSFNPAPVSSDGERVDRRAPVWLFF